MIVQIDILKECKIRFPKACHVCPYEVGESISVNDTEKNENCPTVKNNKQPVLSSSSTWWPDGLYKFIYNIYGNDDPVPATFSNYFKEKTGNMNAF